MRYGIVLSNGNTEKVLCVCGDDTTKETALSIGKRVRSRTPKKNGIVACVYAQFNESNDKIIGDFIIAEAWD